jgi:hypothetical protein
VGKFDAAYVEFKHLVTSLVALGAAHLICLCQGIVWIPYVVQCDARTHISVTSHGYLAVLMYYHDGEASLLHLPEGGLVSRSLDFARLNLRLPDYGHSTLLDNTRLCQIIGDSELLEIGVLWIFHMPHKCLATYRI